MKSVIESLLVFSIMTGVLLPTRLLFVTYVSDNWFGSLGMVSAISLSVIILSKKKKLGFFGLMLERQVCKFQRGRRGLVLFGESVFLLLILGVMIFAIEQGNSVYVHMQIQPIENTNSAEKILEPTKNWSLSDWFAAFLMTPVAFLTAFPQMSATIASIDQRLDGWLLHFYTVGFVEYLELVAILIFYRVCLRKPSSPILSLFTLDSIQTLGNKFRPSKK